MKKPSYGSDKTLDVKVTTRDWSIYRDPAVLLIDQLEKIYIECKRRSENPSLKRPGSPVAPE